MNLTHYRMCTILGAYTSCTEVYEEDDFYHKQYVS